ncbi:MAG TPA: glycoside hydrolase family 2 protein [Opitutaceae bacterium]|nr:glycoside hydrolase family 2 protein [Opitutaceae bacterium]
MKQQSLTGNAWSFRLHSHASTSAQSARDGALGVGQFRKAGDTDRSQDLAPRNWLPAEVPGCVHKDLQRNQIIPDPFVGTNELRLQWIEERDWEYRLRFTPRAEVLDEDVIELVAEGVDTFATFTLNGVEIGETENMFTGYRWNIKRHLRRGSNELRVVFKSAMRYIRENEARFKPPCEFNDPVGGGILVRKQQCQFGWDWAPRFVTCGLWREIFLEGWSENRFAHVEVVQNHPSLETARLRLKPKLQRAARGLIFEATVMLNGRVVATASGTDEVEAEVASPEWWWPAGLGGQTLYDVTLAAKTPGGRTVAEWHRRLGLRTVVLEREPDRWGESFRFVVNGRPIFMKGANWIPAHSFVGGLDRARYARDLRAAVEANFNCLRVWGGGVYESEDFYDLCDELGLLVWQDFMFSCTLYPSDRKFLATVEAEAVYQVQRLHHRTCLALWCGNNELVQVNRSLQKAKYRRGYEKLFHDLLPRVVSEWGAGAGYWPSSQWRGDWKYGNDHPEGERRGDTHFWEVWHARCPVRDYEKWNFRFVSEFGMQSFSSPKVQATYCAPHETNLFGPVNENHQKNRAGNQIILDYVFRRYRFPKDQNALVHLSQLNQAYAMQVAVEHYRRLMPRCMGTIYWQLNDCWPVASWSSIEFTGNWKVLHFAARRFYARALITAQVPGEETAITGNYRRSTVDEVHVWTVYDAPVNAAAEVEWEIYHVDGRSLGRDGKRVQLRYGESRRQCTVKLRKLMAEHGRDNLVMRISLAIDGRCVSEDTVFLVPPRFIELPRGATQVAMRRVGDERHYTLTFTSEVFQHRFWFDLGDGAYEASDNFFELYPKRPKTIQITLAQPLSEAELRDQLRFGSLVDSYV